MGEQPGFATSKATEPVAGSTTMSLQPFVFPHGPSDQQAVEVAKDRIQGRLVEAAVVLNPAAKDRIPHVGQVVDGLIATPREVPTSHLLPHPRRCRIAHRRYEADEVLTPSILCPTRAKRVPQEGELLRGILPRPVVILAVDDVRLLRMDVQPALRQTTFDMRQDLLRLRLRPTVRDDIIRVPLERNVRVRCPHPVVEREVQEDIGQERARDAPLRRSHRARHQGSVFLLHGSGQPPLHIEQNPPAPGCTSGPHA